MKTEILLQKQRVYWLAMRKLLSPYLTQILTKIRSCRSQSSPSMLNLSNRTLRALLWRSYEIGKLRNLEVALPSDLPGLSLKFAY